MSLRKVTILGGTGFVGSKLTVDLAPHFDNVTILTRRKQRFRDLRVLSNVHVEETDVHDEVALRAALEGSDVVVNLIGILNQSGSSSNSFQGAHADLTRKVIEAMKSCGVPRYLHMSALGADFDNGSSEYLRSKGEAENHIKQLAENHFESTIFRPSVIFGPGDSFFNRFSGLLQAMLIMPLACADSKMSPVYVDDVSDAMCAALGLAENEAFDAACQDLGHGIKVLELCGPRDYTLRELVEYTASNMGLKRKVVGLPDWASRLQGKIMGVLPASPFSYDNYLSLQTDSISADEKCRQPTSIEAVVPRYIGDKGQRGQQQEFRRYARR